MGLFSNFPYTDFENLNLDWFLKTFKQFLADFEALKNDFNKLDSDTKKELKALKDELDNIENYIIENLEPIVNNLINELIESGQMYVGVNYTPEEEALNIVFTREE